MGRVRVAGAAVALALAVAVGGCAGRTERFEGSVGRVTTLTDTETGVQYIVVRTGDSVAVTPLLDRWGFPLLADGYQRGPTVGPSEDVGDEPAPEATSAEVTA